MTYFLHADEQSWVESVFEGGDMEAIEQRVTDVVDDAVNYYWITTEDRDDVLKVSDFIQGEKVMKELNTGNLESFEEAEEEFEYAEIQEDRPPY